MTRENSAGKHIFPKNVSADSPFLLLQAIEFPLLVLDQNARVAWLNEASEAAFGYRLDELEGSRLWERLVKPECCEAARQSYSGIPEHRATLDMLVKDGGETSVEWSNRCITDPARGDHYVVMMATRELIDVRPTETASIGSKPHNRETDTAQQRGEARFRTLFDSAAEFIFVIDPEGTIILTNRYVSEQSGYRADELVGKHIKAFFTENSKHHCECNFPVLRDRGHTRSEVEFVCKDGRILQMECSATAIPDEDGSFGSFLIIQRDVTERKLAAQALADSERRFRAIFNSTFQFIGLLSPDGILLEANQAALDFAGVDEKDVVGKPFWDTIWWSASKKAQEALKAAVQHAARGELIRYETEHINVNGKVIVIDFSLKPVKDDKGETVLIIPEGRDISARRQAEEAARHHQRESAHLMRLSTMGEMAAGMAHELNQPLTALISYCGTASSMLKDDPSVPTTVTDILKKSIEQAHRAGDIIRHIRNFVSKGNSCKGPVDIDSVILEMTEFLDWELRNSKVAITLDLASQGHKVRANGVQIEQVLLNLIRNSLEAIHGARISDGHLLLQTRLRNDESIVVTVTDNGPGIDADMCKRLFEPFQTSKESGMGMGLSISRSIIRAHKGKILLSETHSSGTTFCIELPVFEQEHD
ncbi:MAG: PAS domain S-box protein [Thiogranum sp.]